MPLQNRVNPHGAIFASPVRGTFMGNRGGVLHNQNREIVRQGASRRWITCLLEFKGRYRVVMSPGRYTELFFLDEAAALAAGHRPCAECRRERYNAFKAAWNRSADPRGGKYPLADEMDRELHPARIDRRKGKVTYEASLNSLPDGCFVQIDGASYLVYGDTLLLWSPAGYVEKRHRPSDLIVKVLTPEPIVRCIRHGYKGCGSHAGQICENLIQQAVEMLPKRGRYDAQDGD
jgi:hypothetical protein